MVGVGIGGLESRLASVAIVNASGNLLYFSYARPREAHRWYWWPELTSSEVLLFTQFDSADPRGCRMLHSSVHHPQTPEDAPPRRSVELRMLAIFEA